MILALFTAFFLPYQNAVQDSASAAVIEAVPFQRVRIEDSFWRPRIETNRRATIEANLVKCEETGRLANFAVAGGLMEGEHRGFLFNDSDVYKVIEGIAYTLALAPDPALEERTDALIEWIEAAQEEDGYLNTYYTLVEPESRWKNIAHGHELYCAGHLIEAAIAYERATGKRRLLDVAIRFADHIGRAFGPEARTDPPGHQELELALLKLSAATGEPRYRNLAEWFLTQRGSGGRSARFGEYSQDHRPVLDQDTVTGHAVRAMYLYSAMADVARSTTDGRWRHTLEALWNDVVGTKMYVTGGVGNSAHNEGFTAPFELPNDTAYAETCAAIGMGLWNHRMFLLTGEAKYADVLERELYNNVLAGVSLAGDRFFYRNPLESKGNANRVPWFDCSCCPTNIVRYLPAIGERIWAVGSGPLDREVYALSYVGSTATFEVGGVLVSFVETTDYPWSGLVRIEVRPEQPIRFTLNLRHPAWMERSGLRYRVNDGELFEESLAVLERIELGDSYWLPVTREWKPGDVLEVELAMPVRREYADARVEANRGRVAVMRGPLVYCAEGVDNGGEVLSAVLPAEAEMRVRHDPDILDSVPVIDAKGFLATIEDGERVLRPRNLTLVPYHLWNNRGAGEMNVWLIEDPEVASLPGDPVVLAGEALIVSGSHCWSGDTLAALNDGLLPTSSDDHSIPRQTFWDHKGTREWLRYEWPHERVLTGSSVYWFDDTGIGACRVPASWALQWLDGDTWRDVQLIEGDYGTRADSLHRVRFEPVQTRALRLAISLQLDWSGGVLEWIVDGEE